MAENVKEATAVWKEGLAFEATAGSGFAVQMDSAQGGGFTPMELVLAGLAGCTGMDVIDILRKKRQYVTALQVRVKGICAEEHPRKYTAIQVRYVVTGCQVDQEAVRRSIELSETKYCSVAASLRGTVSITSEFEIREAAEPVFERKA
jgi:putative redox protein